MSRAFLLRLLSLGILISLLFAAAMLVSWQWDRQRLAAIAQTVAPAELSPGEKAERLNAWVYGNKGFAKNPRRFIWSRLDATPVDVLEIGGDCEDKSKLLVAMLDTVGVQSTMAMQYPCRTCSPVHTVVLADLGDKQAAFDPVYNMSFPDGRGGYRDVRELRVNPAVMEERLDQLAAVRGAGDKIASYDRTHHFSHITTVNWDKNGLTKAVAAALRAFGQDPALTPRPFFLDNPKQFFAVVGLSLALLLSILGLLVLGFTRRKGAAPDASAPAALPSASR